MKKVVKKAAVVKKKVVAKVVAKKKLTAPVKKLPPKVTPLPPWEKELFVAQVIVDLLSCTPERFQQYFNHFAQTLSNEAKLTTFTMYKNAFGAALEALSTSGLNVESVEPPIPSGHNQEVFTCTCEGCIAWRAWFVADRAAKNAKL